MDTQVMSTTLTGWLDFLHSAVQFEPKIFHPDFSLVSLSGLNVCLGCSLFFLLCMRRCFPMAGLCRHSLRELTGPGLTLHACLSLLIWAAMLIEGRPHERSTVFTMGLNVFLYMWNRAMLAGCDALLERRIAEYAYRKTMDDAVVLYGVSEAHCKEVITDVRMLRSLMTLVHNELNHQRIHDASQRAASGKRAFDSLVARERLHRSMIESPHIQENLSNWRKYMVMGDEEEPDEQDSMEKQD